MVWPTGRDQSFRRSASGIDFGSGQFESDRGCDESGAPVLFSDGGCESDQLPADCIHHRRAAAAELVGAAHRAAGQSASDDGTLSRRTAGAAGTLAAFSLFAIAVVGKYGRVAGSFSGWANAGTRRALVFDGTGAAAFPVAGRYKIADDGVRNGAVHGSGLLDCARDFVFFLGALPGEAGFPRDTAARIFDHGFGGVGDELAVCGVAGAAAGRLAAAKIEECPSPGSADPAGISCRRLPSVSLFDRCESWIAL